MKPILLELDEACSLDSPVGVQEHLVPLFERHTGIKIGLAGVPADLVQGVYLGHSSEKRATIIYQRCAADHAVIDPACPGCQGARFDIAKELFHTLDPQSDKTGPGDAAAALLDQVLRRAYDESTQANTDGWGTVWALEMLVRYLHRKRLFHSDGSVASIRLAQARSTKDYSFLAKQYGVPQNVVAHAFSDSYMQNMKDFRQSVGLPIEG